MPVAPKSFHRRPGEGQLAFEMFLAYAEQGENRSVEKVAEAFTRPLELVEKVQEKFSWKKRAKDYDKFFADVQRRAIEKTIETEAVRLAKRRAHYQLRSQDLAEQLINQAEQMLAAPLYEEEVEKIEEVVIHDTAGNEVGKKNVATRITLKPVRWNKRDVPRFIETADNLMRLSLDMATSNENINVNLTTDETRLQHARVVLEKLRQNVERYVEEVLRADPFKERDQVKAELLDSFPQVVCQDLKELHGWELEPSRLLEGEAEVIQLAEQIEEQAVAH